MHELKKRIEGGVKADLLRVIAAADAETVATALDRLWVVGGFTVVRPPQAGMLMYSVLDPFGTPFYLGEVLVTTAEVAFDGQKGGGVICGDRPETALLLAAVEAVERSGKCGSLNDIRKLIEQLERVNAERQALSSKVAAATRVRFDSMRKETAFFGSLG
ncbi:MAG: hypothetical protein C4576_32385 [Desulfobacteraceae bacterium]|jgi:phosphonate C-P lyase system protein PhnG|nr:MAG: hypothetical protein C4576_32385 [Desulfobacteraceae bacterium]